MEFMFMASGDERLSAMVESVTKHKSNDPAPTSKPPPPPPLPLWSTANMDDSAKLCGPWICTAWENFLLEPSMSTVFNEAPPPIFLQASIMLFTLLSNSATGL
ncbi:LppZ protein [Trichinella spiralis]|uniref:LppZ protein n=1 Tax=Trichinella spiralis TaxID=6334 RepID=UPI0001EFBE3D|nr:LppZ protein [Trichinella spiralis]